MVFFMPYIMPYLVVLRSAVFKLRREDGGGRTLFRKQSVSAIG